MNALTAIMRTIPASPVCPAYEALCVDEPGEPRPVYIYNGRQCFVRSSVRTRIKKGWRVCTFLVIRYLDDGSYATVSASAFAKGTQP